MFSWGLCMSQEQLDQAFMLWQHCLESLKRWSIWRTPIPWLVLGSSSWEMWTWASETQEHLFPCLFWFLDKPGALSAFVWNLLFWKKKKKKKSTEEELSFDPKCTKPTPVFRKITKFYLAVWINICPFRKEFYSVFEEGINSVYKKQSSYLESTLTLEFQFRKVYFSVSMEVIVFI